MLITGGAGGIGRAIARCALDFGALVSLWDHTEEGLHDARSELRADIALRRVDVTDQGAIESALAADVAAFGRIDAFVNSAGILGEVLPLWETDPAAFRRVLEVAAKANRCRSVSFVDPQKELTRSASEIQKVLMKLGKAAGSPWRLPPTADRQCPDPVVRRGPPAA